MRIKTFPIFLSFLCMGFGDVVAPLTSQLQNEYNLPNLIAGMVTFMGFLMFGLLSVPLGIYQDRKGKKHVLLLGLVAAFLGLILPIIGNYSSFILLLGALLLLGTGATMLQVSGNPVMRDVSAEGKYSRNLSFGQFFKAIGSLSGALLPLLAANYWGKDWKILFPVYAVAILVTILLVSVTRVKEKNVEGSEPATFSSCFSLLRNPYVLLMVMGIFLYVGAEVCMSSRLPNYLQEKFDFDIQKLGLMGTMFFFLALMTGRFLGGVILNWMSPKKFLLITTVISLLALAALFIAPTQTFAFAVIFIIGLGFANVFPLIFSITIDAMPQRSNEISGLMITAIIGGAFVPLLFGALADIFTLMAGFIVPILCLIYILTVSLKNLKVA
jgi:MFS transporter, FHS family, L-fucose permease